MTLELSTPPMGEPVELDEAIRHLRGEGVVADEGVNVEALIAAARQWVEEISGRALITQSWTWRLDAFPCATAENPFGALIVPRPPLQEVTSISYVDGDGQTQVLAVDAYDVDVYADPARITPAYGTSWPATRAQPNAVTVLFTAGFGDDAEDVPGPYKQAIHLVVGDMHEHREETITGTIVTRQHAVVRLLAPYRAYVV